MSSSVKEMLAAANGSVPTISPQDAKALMECVSYDSSGQPITGSFMDYAMPRAEDIPMMAVGDHPVPAKSNPDA